MIVINSAAYVVPEFRNELGLIPPCLLPLGNKKLLEHQVQELRCFENEKIYVSLPANYELTLDEQQLMQSLRVEVIAVPEDFSLAEALTYVLNVASIEGKTLRLLHGDTLILDLPTGLDEVAVGQSAGDYDWEIESSAENSIQAALVWSGFFSFSDQREFLRALVLSRRNFVNAVREYGNKNKLKAIACEKWFDLGHVNTYFSSRSKITTQRSFNSLKIVDGVLYKTGEPARKIEAEEHWFNKVPISIKKYTPQLLDSGVLPNGSRFYALEYLPYLPLNELFVHGRNSVAFWVKKFTLLRTFFKEARINVLEENEVVPVIQSDALSLYEEKTLARLKDYENDTLSSKNDVVSIHNGSPLRIIDIAKDCIGLISKRKVIPAILHGDLCFSNILFDSRSERLKIIDPRGLNFKNDLSIHGDQRYDLAKLAHSVIGLYDFIIAGRYSIAYDADGFEIIKFDIDKRIDLIQKEFLKFDFMDGESVFNIFPLVVLLFISMLPLHADRPDRQKAMLLNAIRIYKNMKAF